MKKSMELIETNIFSYRQLVLWFSDVDESIDFTSRQNKRTSNNNGLNEGQNFIHILHSFYLLTYCRFR